ncbi:MULTISPECIES: glycosyltransferase [Mycobacterium]|uniref:Glycosyl transferase n=1 Tax=Mycobacterium kiyosense TaxID=2871094 RepID=A0A9P3UYK9_9MYCO|nr:MULTISPECIES: glycosyltransferase [Mycobacterium]BDB45460.1 glycosyl transferase [Mycobacterium kiyosense]BDE16916.1 glycosyl transferase [Mycobacterium sp. 20KCMC460]GLB84441.1 glycosyl transferase [Mycobacterium kiyosense]GLB91052.1 glycosyl transferase [Mycobacterium kiyosense]GLB96948.1 glycosyl transferase [Mycobacterium kiyosense]
MQIAIVCGDDETAVGGGFGGSELAEFGAALAAQHHTINAYRPHAEVPAEPSAPTLVLPHLGAWADQLDRAWAANPPDVVHAFGWLGGLAAQLAARRHELPLVQSFHGLAESSIPGERVRLEPLLVRNANWVTGGSSAEVDALARLRRSRAQLSVLSSGVDVDRFAPADPSAADGPVRILQVEPNALPQHGFDKVIRILPILPGVELVLAETDAGDPRHDRERTALNRLATGLGVQDRVRFAGSVAAEELPALVRSADVVVCAARHAPQATTALRAMASGVVVVATAVGALTDTVINGVTGLLVSPAKPYELTAALKSLHGQRFQRQSMGAAGRARAISRFTWDRIALDALGVYQRATADRTKSSAIA